MPEPQIDTTHVDTADLTVEPEGILDRLKRRNKAFGAAVANLLMIAFIVITGTEIDTETALLIEGAISAFIVERVRNS